MGQLKKVETQKPVGFQDMLMANWGRIEQVLPKHMSGERLFQMTVSAYNQDPKLAKCDVASLLSCIMKCSALGLEPSSVDGLGRAYILPYWNKKAKRYVANFVLGYKGMIDLARRSGNVASISARAVYEGDVFEYEYGLDEKCRHVPIAEDRSPEKLTHAYCVVKFRDGGHYLEVMTRSDLEKVRARSQAKDDGPWVTDFEAMCRKSPVRRAFPYLPVSVEAQMAVASDETDGGYTGLFSGMALPEPAGAVPEAEAGSGPEKRQETPQAGRQAVCKACGNVVDAADDATLEDLGQMGCCEAPDYEWVV